MEHQNVAYDEREASSSPRSCCADLLQQLLARVQAAEGELATAGQLLGQARAGLVAGRSSHEQAHVEESSLDKVVSGLDDALMCLAELQLQQEGPDSCAAALDKACRCVKRLQETLSAVDPVSPSANLIKLLVEGQASWRAACTALRSDCAGVASVHKSVSALLQLTGSDDCWNGGAVHEAMELLQEARAHLSALLQQQTHNVDASCPLISTAFESLTAHCRAHAGNSSAAGSSSPGASRARPGCSRPNSPRPSSRLGRMSAPVSPRGEAAPTDTAPEAPAASEPAALASPAAVLVRAASGMSNTPEAASDGSATPDAAHAEDSSRPENVGSSRVLLLQPDDLRGQLMHLQAQLHDGQGAGLEQLQAASLALLALSQQLLDTTGGSTAVPAWDRLADRASEVVLSNYSSIPTRHSMRRWRNPVFSTSGQHDAWQLCSSSGTTAAGAGGASVNGATAFEKPVQPEQPVPLQGSVSSSRLHLPAGPVSVSTECCASEEALTPHRAADQLPLQASTLPPCELHSNSMFVQPLTAHTATPHPAAAPKAFLKLCFAAAGTDSKTELGPGLLADAGQLSAPLEQLQLSMQQAGCVLAPAALAALQTCSSSLGAEELNQAAAVASGAAAHAASVQAQLQELLRKLHGLGAACPAMPLPALQVLTVSAGGTAAVADARQAQQGSGDWSIAAVHVQDNRVSLASHRSSCPDTEDETLSPRFAGEHLHAAVDEAAGAARAAAAQQPDLQQEAPSATDVLRLPSQELMVADVSSLFEGRISAMIDLQPGLDGAAEAVLPAAPAAETSGRPAAPLRAEGGAESVLSAATADAAAAAGTSGRQAALARAGSAADALPAAFAAAVEPSTGMQAAPWPASPPPARPATAPGSWPARRSGLRYTSCDSSTVGGYDHLRVDSPRAQVSCMPWRRAKKGANMQPHVEGHVSEEPGSLPSGQSPDHACSLQQQVMLVWSLRDELAAAELQLQHLQQQPHQEPGAGRSEGGAPPSGRRLRAVTMDSAVTRSAALSSSGALAAAKARRTTVDGALQSEHTGRTSPVAAFMQQALKHFRGSTARPGSPAVGTELPQEADTRVSEDSDGVCGAPAQPAVLVSDSSSQHVRRSLSGIAEQDAVTSTAHSTKAAVQHGSVQSVDAAVSELQGDLQCTQQQLQAEQQESTKLLQRLHSAQQHRLDAEALYAAAEQEFAAARQQRDEAEEQVLQLKQQVEQEHSTCVALQQQLQAAQILQHAAEAAAVQLQEQHAATQQELLLAQQHEHELEQRLTSTLQDLQAAAAQSAENPASDAADSSTACAAAPTASSTETAQLQAQLADAQHEQQQLQDLLSAQQCLLARLQEAAAEALAEQAAAAPNTDSPQLQPQLSAAQQQIAHMQAQLAASQAQVLQQQEALQDASHQASHAADAAQQQLQAAHAKVQHMTELLSLHEAMLLQLQGLHQAVVSESLLSAPSSSSQHEHATTELEKLDPAQREPGNVVPPPALDATQDGIGTTEEAAGDAGRAQVIQQLADEVARLMADQAAEEGLRVQLAAAAERNAALQTEVNSLSATLDELRQAATAAMPAADKHHARAATAAGPVQPGEYGNARSQQELLQELEREQEQAAQQHARQLLLQQQLQAASDETAAAGAQVAHLQQQLQTQHECNSALRDQLQAMAATVAELETAARPTEVYAWPQQPLPLAPPPVQPQEHADSPAVALDSAAQTALVQSLSDALNKQAELRQLLQQRDMQLEALTAQLHSNRAAAGEVSLACMPSRAAAVLACLQLGPEHACQDEEEAGGAIRTQIAALLAGSPEASPTAAAAAAAAATAVEPATGAAAASSSLAEEVAAVLSSSRLGSAAAGVAAAPAEGSCQHAEACTEHSTGSQHSGWSSESGQSAELSRVAAQTCPAPRLSQSENLWWGTTDGTRPEDAFALLHDLSLRERELEQLRSQLADREAQLARLGQSENLWGTTHSTRPEDAFSLLRNLSLRERELEQLRSQLADREAQLDATTAQLAELTARHTVQEDQLADLSLELYMLKAESAHRVSAAEAAVKAMQAELQAWSVLLPAPAGSADAAGSQRSSSVSGGRPWQQQATSRLEVCTHPADRHPVATVPSDGNSPRIPASPGGCSEALELPPSTEASQCAEVQATADDTRAAAPVAAGAAPVNAAAAAAITTHLLVKARGAVARAAAAEAQQQQLAHELAAAKARQQQLTEELHAARAAVRAQQQELAQALAAEKAAAEARQQQLAQALAADRAAAQAQQQRTAQALAADRAAAEAQMAEELALQQELHEVVQQETAVLKQRLAAANEQTARLSTCLQDKTQQLQQLQAQLARLEQHHRRLLLRQQQQQQTVSAGHARSRRGSYSAEPLSPVLAASSPAASGSPAGRKMLQHGASPVSSPVTARKLGCTAPVAQGAAEPGGQAEPAADAYKHSEEVRRLKRELTAKEGLIATLTATNKLHKQQLQQLAQSVVEAGLQVTPQHLLHIAGAQASAADSASHAAARPADGPGAVEAAAAAAAGTPTSPARPGSRAASPARAGSRPASPARLQQSRGKVQAAAPPSAAYAAAAAGEAVTAAAEDAGMRACGGAEQQLNTRAGSPAGRRNGTFSNPVGSPRSRLL